MKFKKPRNILEGLTGRHKKLPTDYVTQEEKECPGCKKSISVDELMDLKNVCPYCTRHFRVSARQRINWLTDPNTFEETDINMTSVNVLEFPGYEKKLTQSQISSSEKEAVVCGLAYIGGIRVALFIMEANFMMGSMGSVVGEKITNIFELATKEKLPVIGFTVSGGARMQEGILSLMQMAKVSGAVKRHSDAGLLYTAVLTDPTTGGVSASFAMQADIILSEPFALICFAGPRVIEQTIRKKLPNGFQSAEFLMEKGFVDEIVHRRRLRHYLVNILRLHNYPRRSA